MERERRNFGSRPPMGGQGFGRSPPVNVGDELDVQIEAIGEKGDGVAKKDGFVLFVPGVKQGQNVKIKVTRVLRKVGFAEVVGSAGASSSTATETSTDVPSEAEEDYSTENDSEDFGDSPEPSSDSDSDKTTYDDSADLGEDE